MVEYWKNCGKGLGRKENTGNSTSNIICEQCISQNQKWNNAEDISMCNTHTSCPPGKGLYHQTNQNAGKCIQCDPLTYSNTDEASPCKNGSNINCPKYAIKDEKGFCNCAYGYHGNLTWDNVNGAWIGSCSANMCTCKNGIGKSTSSDSNTTCPKNGLEDCSKCDSGYSLKALIGSATMICNAYAGTCANGKLISQSQRLE